MEHNGKEWITHLVNTAEIVISEEREAWVSTSNKRGGKGEADEKGKQSEDEQAGSTPR